MMNPFLEINMTNSTMGESQGQLFIDRDVRLRKIQRSIFEVLRSNDSCSTHG